MQYINYKNGQENLIQYKKNNQIIVTTPTKKVIIDPIYEQQKRLILESKLNFMQPSKIETYTIPIGTILYHGTKSKETFNPLNIKLSDSNLVAYFSPNIRFAADYIGGCGQYPEENGYIHMFRVTKNIDKILIVSTYNISEKWNHDIFQKNFCSSQNNYETKFNGIGFFIPKKEVVDKKKISYIPEFAICDPTDYLEYINTQRCIAKHTLSNNYRFDG
ncbi:Hypothetical protein KVN_LOCUS365 [uncultured virus]|nr:Hypothetical protein KVN_LOCUS365 [uncultured virus]